MENRLKNNQDFTILYTRILIIMMLTLHEHFCTKKCY